jgi:HK97 family phage portal protein
VVYIKVAIPFTNKGLDIKVKELPSRITDPRYWPDDASPVLWAQDSFKNSAEQLKAYTGWVGDCVSLISQRMASIPLRLYNKDNELIEKHPFYDLMKFFNPDTTEFSAKELRSIYKDLTGECYILMAKDGLGIPRELYFRIPDRITPKVKNGIIDHYVYVFEGREIIYPREDIIFFKYSNPTDPFRGASPVQRKAYAYDIDRYNMIYQLNIFKNGAHLRSVLETDKNLSEEQVMKMLKIFNDTYGGIENTGKTGAAVGGLKLKTVGISNKDMEFMNLANWTMRHIASAYHTPPQKLSHPEQTNRANMRALDIAWNRECILPRCIQDAQTLNVTLIPLYKEEGIYCKYDNPVPTDQEFILKKRESDLKYFVMPVNEARVEDGKDGVPWGDKPLAPFNIAPLGSATEPASGTGKTIYKASIFEGLSKRYTEEFMREYWNQFIKRVTPLENDFKRGMIKLFQEQELRALRALRAKKSISIYHEEIEIKSVDDVLRITHDEREIAKFAEFTLPRITEMVKITGTSSYAELGVAGSFDVSNPKVIKWIKAHVGDLIKKIGDTTKDKLRKTLAEGISRGEKIPSLASRVSAVYDEAKGSRAIKIARTETIGASNQGALQAYDQSGVVEKKEWLIAAGACDDCIPLNKEIVGLHDNFSAGVECPPLHPNCRCTILPVIEKV